MTAPAEVEPRRPDGTRIAMTTPVAMAGRLSDPQAVWTIRFTLPAQWTLADLPRPRDAHVRLAERPARRVLVLRFAGAPGDALLAEKAAEITALARAQGLHAAGPVEFQFYDPPLTLPFNRRNEAVLPLR